MDLLKQYLSNCRNQLIDLTKRNKLINFNLNAKNPRHLDIVAPSLFHIWKAIATGDSIPIGFVPEPDLKKYLEMGDSIPKPKAVDYAKECGINPSLELLVESHKDEKLNCLQSLLYFPDLARFIQKLKEDARIAAEEKGINTLHCMLGFLRWTESKDSSTVVSSPLLLSQVELDIEKRSVASQRFWLSAQETDEEKWLVNPSLQIKLQKDYGIELPLLEQGDTPSSYFQRVLSILSFFPEWSISHRVAIGNISFPRLALYEDLDWQKWEQEKGNFLLQHPVLEGLLSGICREPSDEEIREIDSTGIDQPIKGLVFDADSSQLEAIRRVLAGETMVLEGPPGTGKSQTIANLIAAYLSRGKSILFVADKRAAIEVVERRLEKVGLGDFCLNLHTENRQSKTILYEKLEKRLEYSKTQELHPHIIDGPYEEIISSVSSLTSSLNNYYTALEMMPETDKRSMKDLLWSSLHTRDEYEELPSQIKKIEISSALSLPKTTLETDQGFLQDIEIAFHSLGISASELKNHPFWTLKREDLDPFQIADLKEHIEDMGGKIGRLTHLVDFCACFCDRETISLDDCLQLETLQPLQKIQIQEGLCKKLSQCSNLQDISDKFRAITAKLPNLENSPKSGEYLVFLSETIHKKIAYLNSSAAAKLGNSCSQAIEKIQTEIVQLNQYKAFLAQLFPHICKREGEEWVLCASELQKILSTVENLENQPLTFIRNGLSRAKLDWDQVIVTAKMSRECEKMFDEIKKTFCAELLYNQPQIEQFAKELLGVGFLKRCFPSWKRSLQCLSEKLIPDLCLSRKMLLSQLTLLQKWSKKTKNLELNKVQLGLVCGNDTLNTEALENLLKAHEAEKQLSSIACLLYPILIKSGKTFFDLHQCSQNCFGHNAIDALSRIYLSYANASPNCIDKTIHQAEAELKNIKILAQSLKKLGINDSGNIEDLYSLTMALDSLIQSEEFRTLLSWPIKDIIRGCETVQIVLSDSSNRKKIEDMNFQNLSYIKEIIKIAQKLKDLLSELLNTGYFEFNRNDGSQLLLVDLITWQNCIATELPNLTKWVQFRQLLRQLKEHSVPANILLQHLLAHELPLENLPRLFEIIIAQSKVKEAFKESNTRLKELTTKIQRERQNFQLLDRRMIEQGCKWTRKALLSRSVHQGCREGRRSEWTGLQLIRHELCKQKSQIPPRKLLKRAFQAVLDLMPCFMMSPLKAAECLLASQTPLFDLVIIDEASQLRPEEAFSAIVRGSQLVVVGDSKQLPPTSFFADSHDNEDEAEEALDNESILDMAKATFPSHSLRWHYRSKHESLIYFSNQQFYDNRLIACPSSHSESEFVGVHLIQANGIYKNSENPDEAAIIIDKAIKCMKMHPDHSIGIVAMNREQQELIQSLLYEARCNNDEVNSYLDRWEENNEPFFVKNLENVQGDERDIILISTVYGPTEKGGRVMRRFGPINSKDGHRRLNVLCTRARTCMFVTTSLQPSDILAPDDIPSSKGIEAFAKFLEYAGSGQRVIKQSSASPESPFEEYVGKILSDAGYDVQYQIGQLGFRIDMGIRHPVCPYGFIAGIECDGAAYHSHKSARDRDRLRQEILENHGWKIYRIWSTDWFYHPKEERTKLLNWLANRINELRKHEHAHQLIEQQVYSNNGEGVQASPFIGERSDVS